MTVDEAQEARFEERLRSSLARWADEATVPADSRPPAGASVIAPARRGRGWVVVMGAAAAVLLVVAVLVAVTERDREAVTAGSPDEVMATIPVGERGGVRGVTSGAGGVYVSSENDARLFRIDPARDQVTSSIALSVAYDIVVTDDAVFALTEPGRLARLDPVTLATVDSVAVPDDAAGPRLVDGRIWVVAGDQILRFGTDLRPDQPLPWAFTDVESYWLRSGPAGVWVTEPGGRVVELDPATGGERRTIRIDGVPDSLRVTDDAVWVADIRDGSVVRIDADSGEQVEVPIGERPQGMVVLDRDLWVADHRRGVLSRIDLATNEVTATVPVGYVLGGLAVADGSLWVGLNQQGSVVRLDPERLPAASVAPVLPSDHRVDVGGRTIYLHCSGVGGDGRPTVLLEADAGAWSEEWLFVQYGLQDDYRVCSYDRAGLQRSDPGPEPRTASAIVEDLRAALDGAAIPGPYLLVGQGFGGLYARYFAATHPEEVVGLVLVHAMTTGFAAEAAPLMSEADRQAMAEGLASGPEGAAVDLTFAEVDEAAGPGSLGSLPMVVIIRDAAEGFPDPAIEDVWQRHQAMLADLSTASEVVTAVGTGFQLGLERPDLVIDAVHQVDDAG